MYRINFQNRKSVYFGGGSSFINRNLSRNSPSLLEIVLMGFSNNTPSDLKNRIPKVNNLGGGERDDHDGDGVRGETTCRDVRRADSQSLPETGDRGLEEVTALTNEKNLCVLRSTKTAGTSLMRQERYRGVSTNGAQKRLVRKLQPLDNSTLRRR